MGEVVIPVLSIKTISREKHLSEDQGPFFKNIKNKVITLGNDNAVAYFVDDGAISLPSNTIENEEIFETSVDVLVRMPIKLTVDGFGTFKKDELVELEHCAQVLAEKYSNPNELSFTFTAKPEEDDFLVTLSLRCKEEMIEECRQFLKDVNDELEVVSYGKERLETLINSVRISNFIEDSSLALLNTIGKKLESRKPPNTIKDAIESHELGHASREMSIFREILAGIEDLPNEIKELLQTVAILDEALAMFHELRGQKVISDAHLEPAFENTEHLLYFRLAGMLDGNRVKFNYRNGQMQSYSGIGSALDFLQKGIASNEVDEVVHMAAALLIFAGENTDFSSEISQPLLKNEHITQEIVEVRVQELLENPVRIQDIATVERYDRLKVAYRKRMDILKTAIMEYFVSNPEELEQLLQKKGLVAEKNQK